MEKADHFFKFIKFRKQFKRFVFESYGISKTHDNIELTYDFQLDNKYFFRPLIKIRIKDSFDLSLLNGPLLHNIAFHIGMIEMISYWKAACPEEIEIKPFHLDEVQKKWWKNLYFNGLGEFFYLNSIQTNKDDFVEIISESCDTLKKTSISVRDSVLIPVGGGKDSAVTVELLSELDRTLLIMNPRKATLDSAEAAGFKQERIITLQRSIDPVLLKMNDEGFLNGHTPFSALLAFVSLFCAALSGIKHIALSNESSANESTLAGSSVNHQYSKSFQFEMDFREYYLQYITEDLDYFSFLRPLNELQIARLFSHFPKYHQVFRSCNEGSKTDSWCGCCAKCLFTAIILAPFLESKEISAFMGKDVLGDKTLQPIFNQLIGISETKPFECVGTIDEVNAALVEFVNKAHGELPSLIELYKNSPEFLRYKNSGFEQLSKSFNHEHFLNPRFEKILKQHMND